MKIVVVIGARPQFIKHAPFEIEASGKMDIVTIHTGQHYDDNMSKVFFEQLNIKKPNYMLNSGGGNHGQQTGKMLQEIEPILIAENPDYLLVYGDTNSTLSGALAASKLNIPIIHVEAGLRSFNKSMPEEINRILTDHISDILFTSTIQGVDNLKTEGIALGIHLTGDIMADAVKLAKEVNSTNTGDFGEDEPYIYVTIHRPYNTDKKDRLLRILEVLNELKYKSIFPIHPRTKKLCDTFGINLKQFDNIRFIEPVSYFDNIKLLSNSIHLVTDSGGLQKEAYILKTPCITVRSETEWVETLVGNWNCLIFDDLISIPSLLEREIGEHNDAMYGSGNSSAEIINIILDDYRLNHSNSN